MHGLNLCLRTHNHQLFQKCQIKSTLQPGKKVEQSSTKSSDQIDHKAKLAIDKNDSTLTTPQPRAWWHLDRGG